MPSRRRTVVLTVVLSLIAMVVAACGDVVANDPKVTLADAISEFGARETAGLSFSMAAPSFDPEAAASMDDMNDEDVALLGAVLDGMSIDYRWNRVDPDLPPAEALLETATDVAVVHDGTALLRFRVADSRLFLAADLYGLADLVDAYGDGGASAGESIDEFSVFAVDMFGQEFVDHVLAGGWVEMVDMVDALGDMDMEDLDVSESETALADVLGPFAENDVTVEADPDDANRLRVSTTLGALSDLMAELERASADTSGATGELGELGGLAEGVEVPDFDELADIPAELRDVEVWMYVVLDDGQLSSMVLPIGELALHIGEWADLDEQEQAEFDEMATMARQSGLDSLELRVDVIDVTEPIVAPSDALDLDLEEIFTQMFAPFGDLEGLEGFEGLEDIEGLEGLEGLEGMEELDPEMLEQLERDLQEMEEMLESLESSDATSS